MVQKDSEGKIFCEFTQPGTNSPPTNVIQKATVECEKIEKFDKFDFGEFNTCFLQKAEIVRTNVSITSKKDDTVEALQLWKNKKIYYLPENTTEKFPNVVVYNAFSCSIYNISKNNFVGMKKLKGLYLGRNMIGNIQNDTFDDLEKLEVLSICKWKYFLGIFFY